MVKVPSLIVLAPKVLWSTCNEKVRALINISIKYDNLVISANLGISNENLQTAPKKISMKTAKKTPTWTPRKTPQKNTGKTPRKTPGGP